MSLCSVAEVRAEVTTRLTDTEITNIITRVSKSVVSLTGCSATSTDNEINLACIHLSTAAVLRKMRTNGELPASSKSGNAEQQNTIDSDIADHESKAALHMNKYKYSSGSCCILYARAGVGTVNEELE